MAASCFFYGGTRSCAKIYVYQIQVHSKEEKKCVGVPYDTVKAQCNPKNVAEHPRLPVSAISVLLL